MMLEEKRRIITNRFLVLRTITSCTGRRIRHIVHRHRTRRGRHQRQGLRRTRHPTQQVDRHRYLHLDRRRTQRPSRLSIRHLDRLRIRLSVRLITDHTICQNTIRTIIRLHRSTIRTIKSTIRTITSLLLCIIRNRIMRIRTTKNPIIRNITKPPIPIRILIPMETTTIIITSTSTLLIMIITTIRKIRTGSR